SAVRPSADPCSAQSATPTGLGPGWSSGAWPHWPPQAGGSSRGGGSSPTASLRGPQARCSSNRRLAEPRPPEAGGPCRRGLGAFNDDPGGAEEGWASELAPVGSGLVGDEGLEHAGPVGAEVVGDCLEAFHLSVLRHEAEERVERDEDELEGPIGRHAREVSDG